MLKTLSLITQGAGAVASVSPTYNLQQYNHTFNYSNMINQEADPVDPIDKIIQDFGAIKGEKLTPLQAQQLSQILGELIHSQTSGSSGTTAGSSSTENILHGLFSGSIKPELLTTNIGPMGKTFEEWKQFLSVSQLVNKDIKEIINESKYGTLSQNKIDELATRYELLNKALGSVGYNVDNMDKLTESLEGAKDSAHMQELLRQLGATDFNDLKNELNGLEGTLQSLTDNKELMNQLAKASPKLLESMKNSGLKAENLTSAYKMAQQLEKLNASKIPKGLVSMATKMDTVITSLMFVLSGILLVFGTVGLIASAFTLRYKTLITHKKLFKNPKILMMSWIFVILGGVGALFGAIYG